MPPTSKRAGALDAGPSEFDHAGELIGSEDRLSGLTAQVHSLKRLAFKTSRLLEFCSKRELIAQTGQSIETWPLVILKELMDNAVDEAEEAGTAPVVKVEVSIEKQTIIVSDNGRGLRPEVVADLLDFTSRTSSKEAYCSPTRGQQGNALSTILPMPFVLAKAGEDSGSVTIEACGIAHEIKVSLDPMRQEPAVSHRQLPSLVKTGARITVKLPVSASSLIEDAKLHFLQMAGGFAWLNPHLSLDITWDGADVLRLGATETAWSKWRPSDPTCPHWYDQARFERLIGAQVVHDQDHGDRDRLVREFIAEFRGISGSAKQKAVLDQTSLARAPLSSLCRKEGFDKEKIAALLAAMQTAAKSVKPVHLGVIGKDHLASRCKAAGAEMDSFTYNREVGVTDGLPWVVEVAFAWCPEAESRRLITGVNWSPAIGNPFRQLGKWGRSLDTILSQQRADRDEPVILVLHMACPRVEYTDRGKSALVIPGGES